MEVNCYRSNTMRGLVVALIAWFIYICGVPELLPGYHLTITFVLNAIQGVAIVWAMYSECGERLANDEQDDDVRDDDDTSLT